MSKKVIIKVVGIHLSIYLGMTIQEVGCGKYHYS